MVRLEREETTVKVRGISMDMDMVMVITRVVVMVITGMVMEAGTDMGTEEVAEVGMGAEVEPAEPRSYLYLLTT